MRACQLMADGRRWQEASVMASKGCGANMRVTPVGLLPGLDRETLAGLAQLQAGITHGHPTGLAAAELTAYAVRALLDGATLPELPAQLRARAYDQRTVYRGDWLGDLWTHWNYCRRRRIHRQGLGRVRGALDRLETALLRPDRTADPCVYTGAGFVAEEALATALLCAIMFADEPVAGLGQAAATSGDSDSIACLAGAFLGAANGMAAWPEAWATQIEYADGPIGPEYDSTYTGDRSPAERAAPPILDGQRLAAVSREPRSRSSGSNGRPRIKRFHDLVGSSVSGHGGSHQIMRYPRRLSLCRTESEVCHGKRVLPTCVVRHGPRSLPAVPLHI